MSATTRPQLGNAGLVRRRLLDELAHLRTARLALVVAPAGAGKTTLLAQVAAGWDGPVGWWHAEPADTTVHRVVRNLWRATPALVGVEAPTDLEPLLTGLGTASAADTLLVVDDAHCLAGTEAEAMLEAVITRAPPWLHVLAAGRRMPGFNLSRYELFEVRILDGEQLRFRSWEVEYLLRDVYREPLPPDDAAALARRVSGWAAGLHMFHLSTRGHPLAERRRAVAALDGRSALTRAYLARTVLAELPSDLRAFLVRTCVFDVLTPRRCEALLGEPGTSAQHLAELARRQAFTSSTDGGRTYRYHEVLRAHLAVTLAEEVGDAAACEWHARAGALLAAEGAHVEAARAYARAEDWAAVRRLLDLIGAGVAEGGIEPWRELLPAWLVAEDPWLMLAEGRQLLDRGQLDAAIERLRAAEEHFSDERGRQRCRTTRLLAATWLPAGPALPAHYSGPLRDATRRHPALVAAAHDHPLVRSAADLLAGNVAHARQVLAAGLPDDTSIADMGTRLLRACIQVADHAPDGHLGLAGIVADAEHSRLPWLVRLARAAGVLDGSGPGLTEARAVLHECDSDGDRWGAALALGAICLARSVSADAVDPQEAASLVQRCGQLDAGVLDAWAQALLALATAAAGLPGAELEAQRAESLARSAGVPGARVAAQAAAARCGAARIDVRPAAADCGLPSRVAVGWAAPVASAPITVIEPAPVEVWCFGGFRMHRFGRALDCSAVKPRTRTALRLLAMHAGRPVHRETIIDALWPDLAPAAATRNLHVTLSSLRTFLEPGSPRGHPGLVARDGDAYELTLSSGCYCDVATFHAALDAARQARLAGDGNALAKALCIAVLTYDGDLLPEDGPAEWVVDEREKLRRRAAAAAVDLATIALAEGEVDEAVAAAERCVQIDRYYDPGWRLVVAGYERLGNRAAAVRARRQYTEILDMLEVDAPPGRETSGLATAQPPAGGTGQVDLTLPRTMDVVTPSPRSRR